MYFFMYRKMMTIMTLYHDNGCSCVMRFSGRYTQTH